MFAPFGGRPKRRKSQSRPKSTPTPAPTPSLPAPIDDISTPPPPVLVRTRSEYDLSQPPPYSLICPPEHSSPPTRPTTAVSSPGSRSPPSSFAVWTQPRHARTSLEVSRSEVVRQGMNNFHNRWEEVTLEEITNGTLHALISTKLDAVITSIDGEDFRGEERELVIREVPMTGIRGGGGSPGREVSRGANRAVSSAVTSTNYFTKANLYANSKLPLNLPPLQLFLPTYPLLCIAAQYSRRAYAKPTGKEREAYVNADWRMGTKAMVIKSVPIDDMNCVVFAIRGSQTFMDWAVNVNSAPVSPEGFLDDPGNLCHSGFLSVARKMINPVAARLRSLLDEDPGRSTCSLLMTGHSAGGAVASLLYAHMLAQNTKSELNILTGCFKRIHCLTFGTPPISLLPLTKPSALKYKKSLFMSFINEGDPVPRADKAYIRSLLNLYASPAPGTKCVTSPKPALKPALKPSKRPKPKRSTSAPAVPENAPVWKLPPGTLSNAGRLIILRGPQNVGVDGQTDVKAEITTDQELRTVVFGDPVMHMMKVYAKRIEVLATKAVTVKIWG